MQQLLNPFAQKYPESNEATYPAAAATIRFNPCGPFAGHYLAAGNFDGTVEIWDIETGRIARQLEGHVKTVSSVYWSRNNRYLLTGCLDSTCIIWDLSVLSHPSQLPTNPLTYQASTSSQRVQTIRLDAPVIDAQFHPRTSKIILVTLSCNEVVLIDTRPGGGKYVLQDVMEVENDEAIEDSHEDSRKGSLCCATFSRCGSRIYAGTTRGRVLIIDPMTRYVSQRVQIANSAIRQISFDSSGRNLLTSATDRALRLLSVDPLTGSLTPSHRFQDQVNRTPWHSIGFSGDAEYVMGGAGHKAAHNIFVWDRDLGVLRKVLEGPKESLGDCDWHPTRPVIASTTTSGDIQMWQTSTPDNWAAFAPGFEELEENFEFDEREDEFDIEDETELTRRKDQQEDLDIDILQPDKSYPRRPDPIVVLPQGYSAIETDGVESEAARCVVVNAEVMKWADSHAGLGSDGDDWEGFYLSLDLLSDSVADGGAIE